MRPGVYPAAVTVVSLWLLLGVVQTCAPATETSDPQADASTWKRTTLFDGKGYAWLHAAYQVSDGYVVVGGDDGKGLLIKLDGDGVKQWVRRYSYTLHDNLYGAKEARDGGYILAGMASGEGENEGLLVKTSPDGKEQWHRLFRGRCNRLYGVDETEGGYVLAGSTTGNALGYVFTTDAKGRVIADAAFGTGGFLNVFNSVRHIDGGFLVQGTTDAGAGRRGWVVELDHALRPRREKVYEDDRPLHLSSSLPVPTGGWLLAGMVYSDGYRARLMKVSTSAPNEGITSARESGRCPLRRCGCRRRWRRCMGSGRD